MGFCYFNNIAIAALNAVAGVADAGPGSTSPATARQARPGSPTPATVCHKVAIWDFDAHHGNGTEAIVANNPQIKFASIHQFPAYPGTGRKSFANIDNYPVAPYTPRNEHVEIAKRALDKLMGVEPDLLLVSAGFDAYSGDPLVQMTLEAEDFATFGEWLRKVDIPVGALLEGGYSNELPELIDAFLSAWAK